MTHSLRPLYLGGSADLGVELDGPSLTVRQAGRAPGRYPLNRLSRVVSASCVRWSTPAILGCLDAGVPIFFRDAGGKAVGACYGSRRREATLANLLELAADVNDWNARLDDWFDAMRCRRAAELAAALALHDIGGADPASVRDRAVNALRDRWGQAPGAALRAYAALVRPWTEQHLLDQLGHDAAAMAWPVAGVHLGERFSSLLEYGVPGQLARARRAPGGHVPLERWAIAAFEEDLPAHGRALGRLFGCFEHWLRRLVL